MSTKQYSIWDNVPHAKQLSRWDSMPQMSTQPAQTPREVAVSLDDLEDISDNRR